MAPGTMMTADNNGKNKIYCEKLQLFLAPTKGNVERAQAISTTMNVYFVCFFPNK